MLLKREFAGETSNKLPHSLWGSNVFKTLLNHVDNYCWQNCNEIILL